MSFGTSDACQAWPCRRFRWVGTGTGDGQHFAGRVDLVTFRDRARRCLQRPPALLGSVPQLTGRCRAGERARPAIDPCPSDLVAIFGVGGLGHLALQYALIAGAQVVAVDLFDDKLALAKELGAAYTVNARKEDPAAAIKALGGADAAIALAVSPKAFEQAYGSLRRGGTLVFVGLPADNYIQLPIFETVLNGIKVLGSIVGTRIDLQ